MEESAPYGFTISRETGRERSSASFELRGGYHVDVDWRSPGMRRTNTTGRFGSPRCWRVALLCEVGVEKWRFTGHNYRAAGVYMDSECASGARLPQYALVISPVCRLPYRT